MTYLHDKSPWFRKYYLPDNLSSLDVVGLAERQVVRLPHHLAVGSDQLLRLAQVVIVVVSGFAILLLIQRIGGLGTVGGIAVGADGVAIGVIFTDQPFIVVVVVSGLCGCGLFDAPADRVVLVAQLHQRVARRVVAGLCGQLLAAVVEQLAHGATGVADLAGPVPLVAVVGDAALPRQCDAAEAVFVPVVGDRLWEVAAGGWAGVAGFVASTVVGVGLGELERAVVERLTQLPIFGIVGGGATEGAV